MDQNLWMGVGRLTRPPVFYPPGRKGEAHCKFVLAVNRVVANERGPQADYIPCVLWGAEAEKFVEKRNKGDEVGIIGRIRTDFVLRADGKRDYFWEVRVDEVSYGRVALKNLQPAPKKDKATQAVSSLNQEFGE